MLEVHAILQRQRCNENITKKTGTLSDAYLLSAKHTCNGIFFELKKYIRQLTRNELVAFLKVKITLVRIEK